MGPAQEQDQQMVTVGDLSRRDAMKAIGAAAGAIGIAAIPDVWETPAIEAASLPVAAAASPVPTATAAMTATAAPTATAVPTATPTMVPTATATPVPETLSVTITHPASQMYYARFPLAFGTSTPGSLVTVWIDGFQAVVATPEATSEANGDWTWVMPQFGPEATYSTFSMFATATKPPSEPATAGPVRFTFRDY